MNYGNSIYGSNIFGITLPKDTKKTKVKKEYPRIYDKKENNFTHGGLCILDKAFDVKIKEILNEDYIMSLKVPVYIKNQKYKKFKYIEDENYIKVEGQIFTIRDIGKIRTEGNKMFSDVLCEHISYELLDFMFEYVEYINVSPRYVLDKIFLNTPFTVQYMDSFENIDFFWDETDNCRVAFMKLIEQIGAEFAFDNYKCYVYKKRGQDGASFRVGKNIKRIEEKKSSKDIVTRLYVYGKDGLGIESVNNGKPYIDSQYINDYKHPKCDKVNFTDIDDPQLLLEKGQAKIKEIESPKVIYNSTVIELGKIYPRKKVMLGDTCPIFDEKLEIDINTRVTELEYWPYNFNSSNLILGNYERNLADDINDFDATADIVFNMKNKGAITDRNTISAKWLTDAIDAATNAILAGGGYVKSDGRGILVLDNKDENLAQKVIRINEEGIGVSKNGINGPFTNAMTGEGINASVITAGEIKTSLIKIFGDTHFYWDTNGIYIQNPEDSKQFIKIDKEGIRFTSDGGNTWGIKIGWDIQNVATDTDIQGARTYAEDEADIAYADAVSESTNYINENALKKGTLYNNLKVTTEEGMEVYDGQGVKRVQTGAIDTDGDGIKDSYGSKYIHNDGSESIIDENGYKRRIMSSGNVYEYISLTYAGGGIITGSYSVYSNDSPRIDNEEQVLDDLGVGVMWVTIPNVDFHGRNFVIRPSIAGFTNFSFDNDADVSFDLDTEVLEYDYPNGSFKIRARYKVIEQFTSYIFDLKWKGCKFSYTAMATS